MSMLKFSKLVRKKSVNMGNNPVFTEKLYKYSLHLEGLNLPPLFSLKHLSVHLGIEYSYLRKIVSREIDPYKEIKFKKRTGKLRTISIPHDTLTKIQKWILNEILEKCPLHEAATAFRKNYSIKDNAEAHCGAEWIIKLDLKDFFHHVDEKMIYKIIKSLGYTSLLSFEISRLVTRSSHDKGKRKIKNVEYSFYKSSKNLGYLPQGASTSPFLANLAFKAIDEKISTCLGSDLTYTRYADDIVISTTDKNFARDKCLKVLAAVKEIINKEGFPINHEKTQIIPPGSRKIVTGLVVNSSKPTITKEMKLKIEAHLHFAKKHSLINHCKFHNFDTTQGFLNYLNGLIRFCHSIDEKLGDKYFNLLAGLGPAIPESVYYQTPFWKEREQERIKIIEAKKRYRLSKNFSGP